MLEKHESFNQEGLTNAVNYQPQAFCREENNPFDQCKDCSPALGMGVGVCFTANHMNIQIKTILECEEHGHVCKCALHLSRAWQHIFPVFVPTSKNLHIEMAGLSPVQCCSFSCGWCASGEVQEGKGIPLTLYLSYIPNCGAGWCSFLSVYLLSDDLMGYFPRASKWLTDCVAFSDVT